MAPSPKQVVFLFMAATVTAVVVFLCGVLVGRTVSGGSPRPVFWTNEITEGASVRLREFDQLPPVVETPSPKPSAAATSGDEFSYVDRLRDEIPYDEQLMDEVPVTSSQMDRSRVKTDEHLSGQDSSLPLSAENSDLLERPATALAASETVDSSDSQSMSSGSGFTVQVSALRDRQAALDMAASLRAKNFPAFVVDSPPDAPVAVYRIRVGRFSEWITADQMRQRLETEEQFRTWITR